MLILCSILYVIIDRRIVYIVHCMCHLRAIGSQSALQHFDYVPCKSVCVLTQLLYHLRTLCAICYYIHFTTVMMKRKTSLKVLDCHIHKSATGLPTSASATGECSITHAKAYQSCMCTIAETLTPCTRTSAVKVLAMFRNSLYCCCCCC
jgi:hypothetical protein